MKHNVRPRVCLEASPQYVEVTEMRASMRKRTARLGARSVRASLGLSAPTQARQVACSGGLD